MQASWHQLQKSFGRRISLAHPYPSKIEKAGCAGQPEKEAEIKTAVVGMGVPATAALAFFIQFFSLSVKLIISHRFLKWYLPHH